MDSVRITLAFIDGLGGSEMAFIFVLVLMLFGGKKLPEFARGLGKSIREFKKAAAGVEEELKRAMDEDALKNAAALPSIMPADPQPALKAAPVIEPLPDHDSTPIAPELVHSTPEGAALSETPATAAPSGGEVLHTGELPTTTIAPAVAEPVTIPKKFENVSVQPAPTASTPTAPTPSVHVAAEQTPVPVAATPVPPTPLSPPRENSGQS